MKVEDFRADGEPEEDEEEQNEEELLEEMLLTYGGEELLNEWNNRQGIGNVSPLLNST
jgi:hypothetical protein